MMAALAPGRAAGACQGSGAAGSSTQPARLVIVAVRAEPRSPLAPITQATVTGFAGVRADQFAGLR